MLVNVSGNQAAESIMITADYRVLSGTTGIITLRTNYE